MPAYFEQGFFVREPAWHGLGVVLDDYPGREEAMKLAGHDFDLIELTDVRVSLTNEQLALLGKPGNPDGTGLLKKVPGWKVLMHSRSGEFLHVPQATYEPIPNSVAYDFAELLLEQGFQYETGITLKGGALCALTLLLNEPIRITGDDSITLPYLGLSWAHDGSGSLRGRSTSVRQVCANTVAASEAEGTRLGTDFAIRHTKNYRAKVDEARKAMLGARSDMERYTVEMERLAAIEITDAKRESFVRVMAHLAASDPFGAADRFWDEALHGQATDRVIGNVQEVENAVRGILGGPTVPEAHRFTAYGLHLAGVEYLDHVRAARTTETRVARSLLRDEPAKKKLHAVIGTLVAV